jgi:hypothetical protein
MGYLVEFIGAACAIGVVKIMGVDHLVPDLCGTIRPCTLIAGRIHYSIVELFHRGSHEEGRCPEHLFCGSIIRPKRA